MRSHSTTLAVVFLGLANSFPAPAPVNHLRAPHPITIRQRFRSVGYNSREVSESIAADEVQDDIRAAQRRFKDVARNAEVNFYGQALPSGIVSFSLVINVLFALDTAVAKDLPFVSNDSTEAIVRALYAGVPALIAGALIEVWRLQRLEESANTCAAHVQTELEALLLPCENADSTSTSTGTSGALYSLAQEESSENAHATTTTTAAAAAATATATATATASNNFEEGRGAAGGENPTVGPKAAAVAAAEKLKARVMADAAVSDPSATLRIILAAAAPLSLLAGALGNIGFGERAISDWAEGNDGQEDEGVRRSSSSSSGANSSRGGTSNGGVQSSKSNSKSSKSRRTSPSPSNTSGSSIDGSLKVLVLVVGTCAASCFLHGGLQRGLAQFLGRLANRAAVAWYPSDLALEAADATAPLADFSHYDAATAIAARSASAAMTTPLLFSPFGSGSSFAPWDGGGADDATLVAHAWPVFAALPLAAAPAAAAITALATFACDRGLIFVQRPSWAQTRTAQDEALAAAAARGPSYFAVAEGVPAERAARRSLALKAFVEARARAKKESDAAGNTAAAGRATLGAWAFALSGGSSLAPALSYLGAELAPWFLTTFLTARGDKLEEEDRALESENLPSTEAAPASRSNETTEAQRRGDSL